jgi:transposase
MSGNGKRYNEDFRKMIVELYQTGIKVADLSREYGVTNVTTIYKWIK